MAAYNKFNIFPEHLASKVHDLLGASAGAMDALSLYLTNTAPNAATMSVKADLAGITEQNGYAVATISPTGTRSGGTLTVTGVDKTWTASGGSFGPFRYVILFNDAPTSPVDPLIGWWDYGSSITVNDGESFTVDFGASVFTIA